MENDGRSRRVDTAGLGIDGSENDRRNVLGVTCVVEISALNKEQLFTQTSLSQLQTLNVIDSRLKPRDNLCSSFTD